MRVEHLRLQDFRRFQAADFRPAPGFNLLLGDNGTGKTSVLEALHLMAHGRSFRGRVRDGLVRQGADALEVFVEWRQGQGAPRRAGLRHGGNAWEGRLDGAGVAQLGELCAALAVVSFEPGSHALIDGPGELRRRFLDWGLFHVEPGFLPLWRRYTRALKQRNALLRAGGGTPAMGAWEQELALAGEQLTAHREHYVALLQPHLDELVHSLFPGAGQALLELQSGWRRQETSLADALLLARDRDRVQGYTSVGPQRADLRLSLERLPGRDGLSRGQGKLAALSLLLAQAAQLASHEGHWPALQLDDLASELDRTHQQRVLRYLATCGAQVFVTGTETPAALEGSGIDATVFHVEHGTIR